MKVDDLTKVDTAGKVDAAVKVDRGEKYLKLIINRHTQESVLCDTYDIINACKITCPSMAHAVKKLLDAGIRGGKDFDTDCREAMNSIEQAMKLRKVQEIREDLWRRKIESSRKG